MSNIQDYISAVSAQWQWERSKSQFTLGKLIEVLEKLSPELEITGFGNPHSYRGYYEDLAFELSTDKMTVADALKICFSAMGKVFTGYKGGEYLMGETTPIWFANHGSCGEKIMALHPSGTFETAADDD